MITVPCHRVLVLCVAGLAALTVAAACSSGDSDPSEAESGSDATEGADSTTEEPAAAPVRVVTLNLLHGFFCPPDTDACQAPDRVRIFTELVEAADCPDLVGLQEIGARLEELLPPAVATLCDGEYTIAWKGGEPAIDREMVLTRLPLVDQGYVDIANFPWEAYWVRADSPQGPVDFLTTHFASSSNNPPCAPDLCPPICPSRDDHQRVPRPRGGGLLRAATAGCGPVDRLGRLERRAGRARPSPPSSRPASSTPGSRRGTPNAIRPRTPGAQGVGASPSRSWA